MNRPPTPNQRPQTPRSQTPRSHGARRSLLAVALAVLVLAAGLITLAPRSNRAADAATATSNGWTTSATAGPSTVAPGASVSLQASVRPNRTRTALVDVEVYRGSTKVYQRAWDARSFSANTTRTFRVAWRVPASAPAGTYTVKVGVFGSGWTGLQHWNDRAATFTVRSTSSTPTTAAPATTAPATSPPPAATTTTAPRATTTTAVQATTTTVRPTTTTARPTTTTAAPTTTAPSGTRYFATLPPGSKLPSDAECAAAVRRAPEVRPQNATYNNTRGHTTTNPPQPMYARVTGNFVGTTDEIIQWAACKWGIDEDIVRAQTAVESYWVQTSVGDGGESFGVMQVREPYWGWAFPDSKTSTAYNLDAALAARRNCFEGNESWLNQFERGQNYAAGDMWGCVGLWFAGRWHTAAADQYTTVVQQYLRDRIWTTSSFINYR